MTLERLDTLKAIMSEKQAAYNMLMRDWHNGNSEEEVTAVYKAAEQATQDYERAASTLDAGLDPCGFRGETF